MFSINIKMIIAVAALTSSSAMAIRSLDITPRPVNRVSANAFIRERAESGFENGGAVKGDMDQTKLRPVPAGAWGGRGASLIVDKKSVKIEFDCAEGEIRQQLKIDGKGNFKVDGFYKR